MCNTAFCCLLLVFFSLLWGREGKVEGDNNIEKRNLHDLLHRNLQMPSNFIPVYTLFFGPEREKFLVNQYFKTNVNQASSSIKQTKIETNRDHWTWKETYMLVENRMIEMKLAKFWRRYCKQWSRLGKVAVCDKKKRVFIRWFSTYSLEGCCR